MEKIHKDKSLISKADSTRNYDSRDRHYSRSKRTSPVSQHYKRDFKNEQSRRKYDTNRRQSINKLDRHSISHKYSNKSNRRESRSPIKRKDLTRKVETPLKNEINDRVVKYVGLEGEEDIWQREIGRFDQTEFSINDRFSALSIIAVPLKIDDNISVEIERNIRGNEPFRIPRRIDYTLVDIVRRSDESNRLLSTREDFSRFKDLIELEKRIIKLHDSKETDHFAKPVDIFQKESRKILMESRNNKLEKYKPENRSNHHRKNDRRSLDRIEDKRPENKLSERTLDKRYKDGRDMKIEDSWRLNSIRDDRKQTRGSVLERLGTRIEETNEIPSNKIRRLQPDGEIIETDKNLINQLPDFSKRPDKYAFEAWKTKPELIPRGASYFEHDTREDMGDEWNPRGTMRGSRYMRSFRGSGSFVRRPYNRRTNNPSLFDEWKHDKFEELQDNSLTSTTEK